MKRLMRSMALPLVPIVAAGCMTAADHRGAVRDDSGERLTVGTVQREVRIGMSQSEVAAVLGSPNIVSTDEERREVWIYDKFATESVHSRSAGGVQALIFGGAPIGSGGAAGGLGGGTSRESGAQSRSQRTLTVIIKFDDEKRVRDFAYHTSRF